MAHRGAHEGLTSLLVRLSAGDPSAREELEEVATPCLERSASRRGAFLPVDLREDVVQEAKLILLRTNATGFNPNLGSPVVYLDMVVRRAARDVGATFAPPGSRTRVPPPDEDGNVPERPVVVPLDELGKTAEEPVAVGADLIAEHRCDVATILEAAPAPVSVALERIYLGGAQLTEVAWELGMHRSTLSREIDRFATEFAACA